MLINYDNHYFPATLRTRTQYALTRTNWLAACAKTGSQTDRTGRTENLAKGFFPQLVVCYDLEKYWGDWRITRTPHTHANGRLLETIGSWRTCLLWSSFPTSPAHFRVCTPTVYSWLFRKIQKTARWELPRKWIVLGNRWKLSRQTCIANTYSTIYWAGGSANGEATGFRFNALRDGVIVHQEKHLPKK